MIGMRCIPTPKQRACDGTRRRPRVLSECVGVSVVQTMVDGSADGLRFPLFAASLSSKSGPRTRSGLFTRKFGKSWFRWSARRISFDDCMHSGNWMIAFH